MLLALVAGAAALALTDPSFSGSAVVILCGILTVFIVTTKKEGG